MLRNNSERLDIDIGLKSKDFCRRNVQGPSGAYATRGVQSIYSMDLGWWIKGRIGDRSGEW